MLHQPRNSTKQVFVIGRSAGWDARMMRAESTVFWMILKRDLLTSSCLPFVWINNLLCRFFNLEHVGRLMSLPLASIISCAISWVWGWGAWEKGHWDKASQSRLLTWGARTSKCILILDKIKFVLLKNNLHLLCLQRLNFS